LRAGNAGRRSRAPRRDGGASSGGEIDRRGRPRVGSHLSLARARGASRSGVVSDPLVSIVIPTRNGGPRLRQGFAANAAQRTDFQSEIVAVDSASSDGTLDFLAGRATTLIQIDPRSFDHGATRNLAVSKTRGAFVVLMVQDAVPANDRWLAELVAP